MGAVSTRCVGIVAAALGGLWFAAGCATPGEARFDQVAGPMETTEHDDGTHSAKLRADEADWHVQDEDDYCWAACAQTVLALHNAGPIPSQDSLWMQNVGNPLFDRDRKAATYQEIRYALAPGYRERMMGYAVIDVTDVTTATDLVQCLAAGEAVVIGLRSSKESDIGHAYVAYGLKYRPASDRGLSFTQATDFVSGILDKNPDGTRAPANRFETVGFYLFDPAKPEDGGGLVYKEFAEVEETLDFATSRGSAGEYLAEQLAWIQRNDKGPGVYVRDPLDRSGDPKARYAIGELVDED